MFPLLEATVKEEVLKKRDEVLGLEFNTRTCGKCFIVDYKGANDILVMFHKPMYAVKTRMDHLLDGLVRNPLYPKVQGVGYMGVGKFNSKHPSYKFWVRMFRRVYDQNYQQKCPTYKDVTICKEWLNFQNFAGWCETQEFFNVKDESDKPYQLDKDILVKGNKIYSPETCCFVPQKLNTILLTGKAKRGDCPIGVTYSKRDKVYKAILSFSGKVVNLCQSKDANKAFEAYKTAKESHIKLMANLWKGRVDDKVYEALMNYEVHIDD